MAANELANFSRRCRHNTDDSSPEDSDQGAEPEPDSEPDSDYPKYRKHRKGIEVTTIPKLKKGGSLRNYRRWYDNCKRAFNSDPNRFLDARARINFALGYLEDNLQELFGPEREKNPKIASHWRKFCAWAKKHQLCGADGVIKLNEEFERAHQRQGQSPREFMDYLEVIAAELQYTLNGNQVFTKLHPRVKTELLRVGHTSDNTEKLIDAAERIWLSFEEEARRTSKWKKGGEKDEPSKGSFSKPEKPDQKNASNAPNTPKHSPLTEEEKQRLLKEGKCFFCRESTEHQAQNCPKKASRKRKNNNGDNQSHKRQKQDESKA